MRTACFTGRFEAHFFYIFRFLVISVSFRLCICVGEKESCETALFVELTTVWYVSLGSSCIMCGGGVACNSRRK